MSFTWPTVTASGRIPRKNASRAEAEDALTFADVAAVVSTSKPSPYLQFANQGVDIRPRALWLVEPNPDAQVLDSARPYVRSSAAAVAAASKEWKGYEIAGRVEAEYLYATSISVQPFKLGQIVLAALPARLNDDETVTVMQKADVLGHGDVGMMQWLDACEAAYTAVLKATERKKSITVVSYLNTQSKLGRHRPKAARVVWGKGGTNLRAAVLPETITQVDALPVKGFVVDLNQYTVNCASWDEAHYIAAQLNTDLVNTAIKASQTVGEQGERDIHRRPLEEVPIPKYDPLNDPRHVELMQLSRRGHELAAVITVSSSRNRAAYYEGLVEVMPRIEELTAEIIAEQA